MSWIAAHMNEADAAEIMCQVRPGLTRSDVGALLHAGVADDWKWCAYHSGEPVAAFGFAPINYACWSVYAFGTRRLPRVIPAVSRHMLAQQARLIENGVRRLEARSLASHVRAFRWLIATGARRVCDVPQYGRNGETFILWEWTKDDLSNVLPESAHASSTGSHPATR